jgi:hypothetical protein
MSEISFLVNKWTLVIYILGSVCVLGLIKQLNYIYLRQNPSLSYTLLYNESRHGRNNCLYIRICQARSSLRPAHMRKK